jgi:hypothetical protein
MTLTLSFGLIGLVVDLGWAYWRQEACLEAAQSAAMAGVMYAMGNNSTWPPATCTSGSSVVCQPTATACPAGTALGTAATSSVDEACKYALQNGFRATGKQSVTIAANTGNAPTASGVSTAYYITARTSEQVPLTFLAVIAGRTSSTVAAVATAGVISSPAGDCVYVLDPTGNLALNASNGSSVQSECGYWINSSGATALSVTGGASLKALNSTSIYLVGGFTNANGGSITPGTTHSSPATDPFATRSVPYQPSVTGGHSYSCTYGANGCTHTSTATLGCDHGTVGGPAFTQSTYVATLTMNPGVYCGGISLGNIGAVTFNPGVYILNGGGMNLGGSGGISGGVTGTNVSFFDTGTNASYAGITIANGVNPTLSAPTSGSMAGLLFYQDPSLHPAISSTTTSYFAGGSSLILAGSLYFVNTPINFSNGTSSSTSSVGMVVYDVTFTGGAYFKHDGTNITSLGGTTTAGMVQ